MSIQIEVKLNKVEQEMVNNLPEALRGQVTESLLNAKRESMTTLIANRTTFSVKINEGGTIVVRGLGNRYPMGIRHDSLEVLLSHTAELQKAIADAKAYIASNPEKVEAFKKTRAERSKSEAKLSLVASK